MKDETEDNSRENSDHITVIPSNQRRTSAPVSGTQEVISGVDVVDASLRNTSQSKSVTVLASNDQSRNDDNKNAMSNNDSRSSHVRPSSFHHDKNPSTTSSDASSSYEPYMTLSECHSGKPGMRSPFGQQHNPPRPPKPRTLGRRSHSKSESSSSSLNDEEVRHFNSRVPAPSSSMLPTIPAGDPGAYDIPKSSAVQLRDKKSLVSHQQQPNSDLPRLASEVKQQLSHSKLPTIPAGDAAEYSRSIGETMSSSTLKPKQSSSSSVPVSPVKVLPVASNRATTGMIGPDQMYDFPKTNSLTLPHVSHVRSASDSRRRILNSSGNEDDNTDLSRKVPVPQFAALGLDASITNPDATSMIGRHNYTNSAPGFFQNKESMLVYDYNPSLEESNQSKLAFSAPPRPPKPDTLGRSGPSSRNKPGSASVKQRSQSGSSFPHRQVTPDELTYLDLDLTESDTSSPRTPNTDLVHHDFCKRSGSHSASHLTPHKMISGNGSRNGSSFSFNNNSSSRLLSHHHVQLREPPLPRSTVYKTVDFVKTDALNKVKAIIEGGG